MALQDKRSTDMALQPASRCWAATFLDMTGAGQLFLLRQGRRSGAELLKCGALASTQRSDRPQSRGFIRPAAKRAEVPGFAAAVGLAK
jgi:hypothetical protein